MKTIKQLSLLFFINILLISFSYANDKINFSFNNKLVDASDSGEYSKIISLLNSGFSPNDKGDFGATALMRASYKGYNDIVKTLIERGVYINDKDIAGETALHLAVKNNHTAIAEMLIKAGADIDSLNDKLVTPLMGAIISNNTKPSKLLISHGAKIDFEDLNEKSAITYAKESKNTEIMNAILESESFKKLPSDEKKEITSLYKTNNINHINKNSDPLSNISLSSTTSKNTLLKNNVISIPETKAEDLTNYKAEVEKAEVEKEKKKEGKKEIFFDLNDIPVYLEKEPRSNKDNSYYNKIINIYFLNLGKFVSYEQAIYVWDYLKENNFSLLKDTKHRIISEISEITNKKVYTIHADSFYSKERATKKCESLKEKNISCFVGKSLKSEKQKRKKDNMKANIASQETAYIPKTLILEHHDIAPLQKPDDIMVLAKNSINYTKESSQDISLNKIGIPKLKQEYIFRKESNAKEVVSKDKNNVINYKDIDKSLLISKAPISEAVLVEENNDKDPVYKKTNINTKWLLIGNFPDKVSAFNYWTKKIKSVNSLKEPEGIIKKIKEKYILILGPIKNNNEIADICKTSEKNNLFCKISSKIISKATKYWLEFGRFKKASEAEYYLKYLQDNHSDILKYYKEQIELDKSNSLKEFYFGIKDTKSTTIKNMKKKLIYGPFKDKEKADEACKKLISQKINCFIYKE